MTEEQFNNEIQARVEHLGFPIGFDTEPAYKALAMWKVIDTKHGFQSAKQKVIDLLKRKKIFK